MIASQSPDSNTQIQRYIRLTHLVQPILDMVDQNSFALNAAVEISYLSEEHQNALLEAMDYAQVSPSLAQARRIRAFLTLESWTPTSWMPFYLRKSRWNAR